MSYLLEGFKMLTREKLTADYLDFVNNYLTVETFAEHRGLTPEEAKMLLAVSQSCFNNKHPEA